ncbi:unnamed protein product [Rotaria magnacalcarata]|uniref:F-box domain-containing protein n=2 Tax=Rotaria magnacalcarata TaxID=392030 RepID=A0A816NNS7_9BILA|nr:unnamed protein product [Rotaria magnacalcarata]CAF2037483.1 unnamed protein product [Rotaria magnacalcarata]
MEYPKRSQSSYFNDCNDIKRKRLNMITTDSNNSLTKSIIHFEDLSNEIIYEIFGFLDFRHTYDAFSNLNKRFQNFLTNLTLPINIDMSSMSKSDFQKYYKQIIIPNTHRIKSLHLSNPFSIDLFLTHNCIISKLIRLKTLILYDIQSIDFQNLLIYLISLPYLCSLVPMSIRHASDTGVDTTTRRTGSTTVQSFLMAESNSTNEENVEDENEYKKLMNNHRQAKRRQRLAERFCSNDVTDLTALNTDVENFRGSDDEDYFYNDTVDNADDSYFESQFIVKRSFVLLYSAFQLIDSVSPDGREDGPLENIDIGNEDIVGMFDDDEEYENIDAILESMNGSVDLELAIAEYVTHANLDKLKTNDLINLLNLVHDQEKSPPASSLILWNRLNIKFNYYTIEYCTSCEIYKKQSGRSRNPITLFLYTDGKPVIKSSKSSIWPVLATVVEIPRPYRDYRKNMFMLCLWHSPRSPTVHQLFGNISEDLSYLIRNGIDIDINSFGSIHFDIFIQGICADGPGQSKVTEMVSHNGYYACRVCEIEGQYSAVAGTCTYAWSSYELTDPPFRTKDKYEICLQQVEHLKKTNNKNINIRGIKGISPLNHLIFIPTQAVYDYMHLCLEVSLCKP